MEFFNYLMQIAVVFLITPLTQWLKGKFNFPDFVPILITAILAIGCGFGINAIWPTGWSALEVIKSALGFSGLGAIVAHQMTKNTSIMKSLKTGGGK